MKKFTAIISFYALLAVLYGGCTKEEDLPQECNSNFRPVVALHGFLASGDTYARQFQRFNTNGYCWNYLYAYDWNTTGFGADISADLDAFIDQVLSETGATQVDLIGHSAGGGNCYTYLSNPARAAKVAHYVHIGSSEQAAPAGPASAPVPTLTLSSPDDLVGGVCTIDGATNVSWQGVDHYEVATSSYSFVAMYSFFNNQAQPLTIFTSQQDNVDISGKALTLGENVPMNNASIDIYLVDADSGERLSAEPLHNLTTNAQGLWGPVSVPAHRPLELVVRGTGATDRTVHYYREGFTHSDKLVYLRTLPPPFSLAGLFLGSLPADNNQSVLAVFSANRAVIDTRDQLSVNDISIATPEFAPADKTAIAFFLYDDGDATTELTPVGAFGSFPFLSGIDMFFPTNPSGTIHLRYNERSLNVKNWQSEDDGIIVAVFN